MATRANDRNDYAKLTQDQILSRIANANRRMKRCVNVEDMMTDMYAVDELTAALVITTRGTRAA